MRENVDPTILPAGSAKIAVEEIIEQECISNPKIHIEAGSSIGDNYIGDIYRIKISGIDSESKEKQLLLVLKSSTRTGKYRTKLPHNDVFKREVFMYHHYLPTLYKIQYENNIVDGLMNVAKLYKYSTVELDEYLIMSDQKAKGFEMLNRQKCLDLNHCQLILKQLACLHGLGYVFKYVNRSLFDEICSKKNDLFADYYVKDEIGKYFQSMAKRACNVLDRGSDLDIYEKFSEYSYNILENIAKLERNKDEYCTMIHGDCWHSNMFIKYKASNLLQSPVEVCLLDWQLSHLHSPVKDLAYFIYTCTGTEFREKHFQSLLDYYYENLTKIIQDCRVSPEIVYPYEMFQRHIKRYFCHGVNMAVLVISVFVKDADELQQAETNGSVIEDGIKRKSKSEAEYTERIVGVIKHAVSQGFI